MSQKVKYPRKMPEKLFVYSGDNGDFYAFPTARECADLEESRLVGEYVLNQTIKLSTLVQMEPAE